MMRSVLVGAVACLLMSPVPSAVAVPVHPTETTIEVSESTVIYNDRITISGQVAYFDGGDEYAIDGAEVTLQKRYAGTSSWINAGTSVAEGYWPQYQFEPAVTRNTEFRVTFNGDDTYGPSSASASVEVYRKVSGKIVRRHGDEYSFKGKVKPDYGRKKVQLMRQSCSQCKWKRYAKQKTTTRGKYRFTLPNPPRNTTYYFRAKVRGGSSFLKTYSDTWRLTRIL